MMHSKTAAWLIRDARRALDMTQFDVAFALKQEFGIKYTSASISGWERGMVPVPEKLIPKLCHILGLNPSLFLRPEPTKPVIEYVYIERRPGSTYADVR